MINTVISQDVLEHLLGYVSPVEKIYVMSNVCKYWQEAINMSYRERMYAVRKSFVDYVTVSSDSFHPNAPLLDSKYDRLLFRTIIHRVAAMLNVLPQNSISKIQQQQQQLHQQQQQQQQQLTATVPNATLFIWLWSWIFFLFMSLIRIPALITQRSEQQLQIQQLQEQLKQLQSKQSQNSNPIKSIKLCICGDANIGKTALFNRFCNNRFADKEMRGATYCQHHVYCRYSEYERKTDLEVWNVAGVEQFEKVLNTNITNSSCVLLCFDITNRESFESIRTKWITRAKSVKHGPTHRFMEFVLVGLKSDRSDERQVSAQEASEFAERELNVPYLEVSSLGDVASVSVLFAYVVVQVYFRMKITTLGSM
jgi:small GTP-binding protein